MILVPAKAVGAWKDRALARRWQEGVGFPAEITRLLRSHDATASATMLVAIPEHQVPLTDGSRAARTDLWILARTRRGLLSIVVEEESADSFDTRVAGWESNTTERAGAWPAVCALLEIDRQPESAIGSHLLHRTACALLEARRFFAPAAAVIIHAFGARQQSFAEFGRFVALMGGLLPRPGELVVVPPREGIALMFGWAEG